MTNCQPIGSPLGDDGRLTKSETDDAGLSVETSFAVKSSDPVDLFVLRALAEANYISLADYMRLSSRSRSALRSVVRE